MSKIFKCLPWVLLIIVSVLWFRDWKNWKRFPKTIIKTEKIEIPVPIPVEVVKWKEKILYREAIPETVIIDTTTYGYEVLPYIRPWGTLELRKGW